jgi:hypothetical protein
MNDPFGTTPEPSDELSALKRESLRWNNRKRSTSGSWNSSSDFGSLLEIREHPPERVDSEIVRVCAGYADSRDATDARCSRCCIKRASGGHPFRRRGRRVVGPVGLELPVTMHPWVFERC